MCLPESYAELAEASLPLRYNDSGKAVEMLRQAQHNSLADTYMGHITGFKTFDRELPAKVAPAERIHNYKEFVGLYPPEQLNHQAARCMDCGVPFCHSGCPLGPPWPAAPGRMF